MKVLHLMLSNFYIDNYNYQENILPRMNKLDGHEVKIISSTETFADGKYAYKKSGAYINEDGIEVVRLPYKKTLPHFIMKKIRAYIGLYEEIDKFKPDIILSHGMPFRDVRVVTKYKKNNPYVKLYLDSHGEFFNSATNFFSDRVLHKIIYRNYLKKVYPYVEKIFYLSPTGKRFIMDKYKTPEKKLVYWPLGGIIVEPRDRTSTKLAVLKELNIDENSIIFMHTGKFDAKKRSAELLRAFSLVKDNRFKLIIAGVFLEDVKEKIISLINADDRILFIGWKDGADLLKILCAADVYCQPGSVSATLQNSMCCGAIPMIYPHEGYKYIIPDDAAFYVETEDDMIRVFNQISADSTCIEKIRQKSYEVARELLDYSKISKMYIL